MEELIVLLAAVIVGIFTTILLWWTAIDKKLDTLREAVNQLEKRDRYQYFRTTEWMMQKDEEETER